ncbi:hypothetical protein Tco_0878141 [Tanacetum coccineum]|uniref:Uncharacterized protein n=1 Tax=Tanacetum coccineum TaxID=301880 RepID=A0ABQ5BX26_9ASTR
MGKDDKTNDNEAQRSRSQSMKEQDTTKQRPEHSDLNDKSNLTVSEGVRTKELVAGEEDSAGGGWRRMETAAATETTVHISSLIMSTASSVRIRLMLNLGRRLLATRECANVWNMFHKDGNHD